MYSPSTALPFFHRPAIRTPAAQSLEARRASTLPSCRRWLIGVSLLFVGSLAAASAASSNTIALGSQRELFADDFVIDHLGGHAELRLHHPQRKEVAMECNAPWEGNGCSFFSIFKDGDRYLMYYMAQDLSVVEANGTYKMKMGREGPRFCCVAESSDAIHWKRLNVGLYEFNGSKDNNIVFANPSIEIGGQPSEPAVFRDENPSAPADARYKAFLTGSKKNRGVIPYKSPDGIHWTAMADAPVIRQGAFDSQNLAFWDAVHGTYRAYWRYWTEEDEYSPAKGMRGIRTATSPDFIHWSNVQDLQFVDSPLEQLYTNHIKPYYRAPQIIIGFPMRYLERGWSASMRALPDRANREARARVLERYGVALTDCLIMFSRDGVMFKRWNEAFLRPGLERPGTWNYGSQDLAWQLLETKSDVAGEPNELSLYAADGNWIGDSVKLRRYTLRIDGFVSLHAAMDGGELVTKPLTFKGTELSLNFSTSAAGSVKVELQDTEGHVIPGFARDNCAPIFGDSLDRLVTWGKKAELGALQNKPIRICFIVNDADVYSFQFVSDR